MRKKPAIAGTVSYLLGRPRSGSKNKIIPPPKGGQDVQDQGEKKKNPATAGRGLGSGDHSEPLIQEPLLGFLHSALGAVLEKFVVPPDGAVAIVHLHEPPVGGTSIDVFGQGEQNFHDFSDELHEEKARDRG